MSLYPSLEDFTVDQHAKAAVTASHQAAQAILGVPPAPGTASAGLYSGLGLEELVEYGGLDISQASLVQYMGQDIAARMTPAHTTDNRIAVITKPGDLGMARAAIQQGVHEAVLEKGADGKLGVALNAVDKGVFVAFVWAGSPAARAGLRFGDQILQINGATVAGWTSDKSMKALRSAAGKVSFIVRDRPFERTITTVKDRFNHIGFTLNNGEISALVADSSAARNGLLIHHNLVEVNGQNVVAMKDKDIIQLIQEAPPSVTLTIMPTFMYNHLIKNIGFSTIRKYMDHSVPDL